MARPNAATRAGYVGRAFEYGSMRHPVYRRGEGPPVLLLHELPGLIPATITLAEIIRTAGFSVVVPALVGPVRDGVSAVGMAANGLRLCVSWQFVAVLQGRTSPIVAWLVALARAEHARHGGRGVGVIGMCMSGGFALGAAIDPSVRVAVASQPSLPMAAWPLSLVPGQARDLGVSEADLERLRERRAAGELCIRALRYERDRVAPLERIERLQAELGEAVSFEPIPSVDPAAHPVLTDAALGGEDHVAWPALERTIALLRERLGPPRS